MSLKEAVGRWQLFFETPDGQVQEPVFELFSTKDGPNVEFTEGPEMDIRETKYQNGVLNVVADIDLIKSQILFQQKVMELSQVMKQLNISNALSLKLRQRWGTAIMFHFFRNLI